MARKNRPVEILWDSVSFIPKKNVWPCRSSTDFFFFFFCVCMEWNWPSRYVVLTISFSRIDYGNALLLGATEKDLTRLQRLQNRAARLINLVGRDHPSAPLLQELHWLRIRMRIQFKILVYVYKCRYNLASEYLSELVLPSTVTYATRSSFDTSLLHIPKTKNVTGDSAFHAAAPRLWNKLPRNIREAPSIHVFKSLLKTHLFWNCSFFAILDCSVYFILYLFLCLALCSL